MTEIYVLRHGQTSSNLRNACIGFKDVPLDEIGKAQAQKLSKSLSSIGFDVVYTSPLSRAIDTIAPFLKENPTIPVYMSYAFCERNFGRWEDLNYREIEQIEPELFKKWQSDQTHFQIPDGESISELRDRVDSALEKILTLHKGKKILIVTHLLAGRNSIASLLGLPKECDRGIFLSNAMMAKIEIKNGKGTLVSLNAQEII